MTRDRWRDILQLRLYGLSAAMGACFGAAYGGASVGSLGGFVGAFIGAVVGLIMAPALIIARESSGHPLVLPFIFTPTLLTSLGVGFVTTESSWTFLVPCGVYLVTCLTAGQVFRRPVIPPGCCRGCGYDMRGLTGPRCPECGWRRVVRRRDPGPIDSDAEDGRQEASR